MVIIELERTQVRTQPFNHNFQFACIAFDVCAGMPLPVMGRECDHLYFTNNMKYGKILQFIYTFQ